jgi:two-component system response regulator YesN
MNNSLKLLIVDDNEMMRSVITKIVMGMADEVHECSNSVEALGEYGIFMPDWVLMDATMESMDGITTTELIRQFYPNAKVMLIGQDNNPNVREKAQQAGATAFIAQDKLSDIPNVIQNWYR